ncbi:unnamed protein product [Pocillopora meandrina]|uniref:Fibrinogen C-terminal domain-containing protein n=1 Tax=Pocillopora meandrina TaxID=46732 RepID=A0AAU9XD57_9CNID|nr:unnamed protein product [Pocillopora meandrina]
MFVHFYGAIFVVFVLSVLCEVPVGNAAPSEIQDKYPCPVCKLLKKISQQNENIEKKIDLLLEEGDNCSRVTDCADIYKCGHETSDVYTIHPHDQKPFDVFCDQTTDGGGWTVFQKRLDGSVDFYRGWNDYQVGFGNLQGEFWLGLDKLHGLTINNKKRYELRVDLEDTSGNQVYAAYDYFAVSSGNSNYQLSLGKYHGTAGDSLSGHKSLSFATKDNDNDLYSSNCAVSFHGAWWYGNCHSSNLNGAYHHGAHASYADGVNWHTWKGYHYSAKRAEMKIRPDDWTPL